MARAQSAKSKKVSGSKLLSVELIIAVCLAIGLLVLIAVYSFSGSPSVSGSIEYGDGAALPQGSKLSIQLRDVSYADAPSQLIAETIIVNPGPPPVDFKLDYDAEDIEEGNTYSLQVSIYDPDDQLLFANDTSYDLDNPKRSTRINLALVAVQRQSEPIETETPPATDTNNQQPEEPETPPAEQQTEILPENQPPVTETQATVTVNIHYDEDYKLPDAAELKVYLQNVGRADRPRNAVIAEKEITASGRPPVAVKLAYDPAHAPADSLYLISAGIYRSDGKQLMTNSTFGAEMTIDQLADADIYLIAIYPDEEKTPEELDASVTGSINYKKSCRLPEGSKLVIQIRDTSYADGPSLLIAEKEIIDPGGSPVKFELKYDSSDIENRNLYSVSGSIYSPDGQLLFINDTVYEVITRGNPSKINLPLIIVKADC